MVDAYLRPILENQWLRPETAVWRTLDCMALEPFEFADPILDIGCGDGTFSFLRAGGGFDLGFDAFQHVGALDQFFSGADIYNRFDEAAPRPLVTRQPRYRIAVGFDHKRALLDKARLLGLYDDLVEGDGNKRLPFPDGSFATVYSNVLYWIENYPHALREIRRVLKPGGRCIVQVPSDTFRDYSFYQRLHVRTGDPEWAWLQLIDRGRSDNIKHCKSRNEWETEFAAAGLRVEHCRRYLSKLVLEAWDVGLRPISPVLIEMANALSPEKRREVKAKWVDNLMPLLRPLCRLETPQDAEHPPGFFLFVLTPARS